MSRQYRGRTQKSSPHQNEGEAMDQSPLLAEDLLSLAEERHTLKDLLKNEVEYLEAPLKQGPPKSDQDRIIFYRQLVLLKASRLTDSQCAEALGVSVSSIANYKADPYFEEMQQDLVGSAKERGYLHISSMIDPALETLLHLMEKAKSEFTRFSAAKALLEFAGYNVAKENAERDSREGVVSFLAEVESRRQQRNNTNTIIQVQVHTAEPGHTIVESTTSLPASDLHQSSPLMSDSQQEPPLWSQTVLPGGHLPPQVTEALAPFQSPPESNLKQEE